jgi:hypothetical protein
MPKNKLFRTLTIIIFSLCLVIIPTTLSVSAQDQNINAAYVGVWSGTGNQVNGTNWSILLSVVPGSTGSIVGTISYPSLTCGGELRLKRVTDSSIELSEKLTYGAGRCVDRGTDVLQLPANQKIAYSWLTAQGKQEATGTLIKISSN